VYELGSRIIIQALLLMAKFGREARDRFVRSDELQLLVVVKRRVPQATLIVPQTNRRLQLLVVVKRRVPQATLIVQQTNLPKSP
jgi:hypothetical protein